MCGQNATLRGMTDQPAKRQSIPEHATKVFSGILFDVYQWEQELYDGSTATFEKLKRRDSAVIIPVCEDGLILIEEDTQPGRATVVTFPGGQVEDGEDPMEGGMRELLEETGYTSDEVIPWKRVSPGSKIDWTVHFFIARKARKVAEPLEQAGEKIAISTIAFDELLMLPDNPLFQQREVIPDLLYARYDEEKRAALKSLLYGS